MWLGLVVCGWCWKVQRNRKFSREGEDFIGCEYCGWYFCYYILH